MKKIFIFVMVAFLSLSALSSVSAHPHDHDKGDQKYSIEKQLAMSKKAIKKYRNIDVALDEGFVGLFPGACVPNMGIHLVKPSRMDDDKLNIKKPEVLLYEPMKNGHYKLVGAEWYVPTDATDKTPMLFKQNFQGPMNNHDGTVGQHYDLHVWLFKTNLDGIFKPENTRVSCEYAE